MPVLLFETLPALAQELERLLIEANEPALSAQIHTLTIVDRCHCGDDFCATLALNRVLKDPTAPIIAT